MSLCLRAVTVLACCHNEQDRMCTVQVVWLQTGISDR